MSTGFEFMHPQWLGLLALLPIIAWWRSRMGSSTALVIPSTMDAAALGKQSRSRAGSVLLGIFLLGLTLLVIALARPRYGSGSSDVEASGIDIMLVVDVSGSMEAMDFELHGKASNRLEVVKDVLSSFLTQRGNDKIGIVAFAGLPYLVSPLTTDHTFVEKRIESLQIGQVEDGTAIGTAIASAARHLEVSEAKSKIMILLTDGVNNAGPVNPLTASEAAKALKIKIYSVGVGTRGEAPIPVQDGWGRTRMARMKVEIDEEMLQKISESTQGRYYRATDRASLETIYQEIDQLEKTERKIKKYQRYDEWFLAFLLPGMMLLYLDWSLRHTRWRTIP